MSVAIDLPRFIINVSDDVLNDLRSRLKATRWSTDLNNETEHYGIGTDYMHSLVEYWADGFDWRAVERRLNEFVHHRVEIEGVPIHFVREPGKGPNPIPIVLSHGWPWTFWDWSKVIRPLADPAAFGSDPADAFDVIVPSLAGFGFSTPVSKGDMNFWKMSELWHSLMTRTLGYTKYAAGGSDYGALITNQLGHKYAASLYGIHLCKELPLTIFQSERPWDLTEGRMVPRNAWPELRESILLFQHTYASHVAAHMLDGQTITHGLNDSPAGMLAWLLQRWRHWSDRNGDFDEEFPRDHVLTNATIYWVNQAIGSSIRCYANANRYPWVPSHNRMPLVEAPAGFTFLLGDASPPGVTVESRVDFFMNGPMRSQFNVVYAKAFEKGGHFAPWENPDAVIEGVRDTFRELRRQPDGGSPERHH
jgi:pimeloyl-ACP methyl ester carboxylesterase